MGPARGCGSSRPWNRRWDGSAIPVRRNKPYAGGFITEHYGVPASRRHAVQIEINRALYMDERTVAKADRWTELAVHLQSVVEALILRVNRETARPPLAAE